MKSTTRCAILTLVLCLAAAGAASAEADRVGTLIGAIWCNDGQGTGKADRVTEVTICQNAPADLGPEPCPDYVDKVLLEFSTENPAARGRVRVTVNHLDADGDLLASFSGSGRIRKLAADVEVLLFESLAPGDWLEAVVTLPNSARKLYNNQCAVGSLAAIQ